MIPSHIRAKRAAYKALAAYRINAADRDDIAGRVTAVLTELPAEYLQGVVDMGIASGIVGDLCKHIPIPAVHRRDAAAAAVAAAAAAMLGGA